MKAMLYMTGMTDPVAVLDEINLVEMNDNHSASPHRVTFTTSQLGAEKIILELHRDKKMRIELDDGRKANVLLQHSSLDSKGKAVGVLRVLGDFAN